MVVYIFLVIACLIVGGIMDRSINKNHRFTKNEKICCIIIFMLLFIVSGIRYDVGQDYIGTYTKVYELLKIGRIDSRVEFLCMLIYRIMWFFRADSQWFFVISSFIINYFIVKSIKLQSESKNLSIFIYLCGTFYFITLNIVRQAIAISIFFYSLYYLMKYSQSGERFKLNDAIKFRLKRGAKNALIYLRNTIIGAFFHQSGWIYVPMLFTLDKRLKLKTKIIILVAVNISGLTLVSILTKILYNTKFYKYIYESTVYTVMGKWNFSMILNLLIWLSYEFMMHKEKKTELKDTVYSNIHFYGVIISMFSTFFPLVLRVFSGFRFIEYLSVPNLLMHIRLKKERQIVMLIIYVAYFLYFIYIVGLNGEQWLPYRTFWSR